MAYLENDCEAVPVLKRTSSCPPLCPWDLEVIQQGRPGRDLARLRSLLAHLTQRFQLLWRPPPGQPQPTVMLKPQWNLLRQ